MERWNINCVDYGKFILTCVDGSYEDGFYDGEEDAFYCKECAEKHGLKR